MISIWEKIKQIKLFSNITIDNSKTTINNYQTDLSKLEEALNSSFMDKKKYTSNEVLEIIKNKFLNINDKSK